MNDEQIEKLLRKAPHAAPPDGLLEQLQSDITLPRPATVEPNHVEPTASFRRWLPALGFAGCLLACAVVFAVQTATLSQLRNENEDLRVAMQNREPVQNAESQRLAAERLELGRLRKDNQELQQLREEVARLRGQLQEIALLKSENQKLQADARPALRSESNEDFFNRVPDAQAKTERIRCVNNLKQIGMAARIWAVDNHDLMPRDFLAMAKELSTPKLLHCPGDTARPEAKDWSEFSAANNSYEMLSPGADENEPQVAYVRCLVHNNVCLIDGSVQQLGPDRKIVLRDGKWLIE